MALIINLFQNIIVKHRLQSSLAQTHETRLTTYYSISAKTTRGLLWDLCSFTPFNKCLLVSVWGKELSTSSQRSCANARSTRCRTSYRFFYPA